MSNYMKNIFNTIKNNIQWNGLTLFLLTLMIHTIVVVLLNLGVVSVPASPSDDAAYHLHASAIADLLRSGKYTWAAIYPHHWYPLFVGGVYALLGTSILVGSLVNAVVISGASVLLYRTILLKGVSKSVSFVTVFIVMNFYASLVYMTSLLLKESLILALLIIIIYSATKMAKSNRFLYGYLLLFFISFILLRNLRFFVSFAAMAGFFIEWFFNSVYVIRKRIIIGISMFIGLTVITGIFFTGWGIGKNMGISQYVNPKFIFELRRSYYSEGTTTTKIAVVKKEEVAPIPITVNNEEIPESPEIYKFSGKSILSSFSIILLGPFPWQLSLRQYMVVALDLIVWYALFLVATTALVGTSFRKIIPFVVMICILLGALVLGVDNLGALMRYRIPVLIVVAILSALGFEIFKKQK